MIVILISTIWNGLDTNVPCYHFYVDGKLALTSKEKLSYDRLKHAGHKHISPDRYGRVKPKRSAISFVVQITGEGPVVSLVVYVRGIYLETWTHLDCICWEMQSNGDSVMSRSTETRENPFWGMRYYDNACV